MHLFGSGYAGLGAIYSVTLLQSSAKTLNGVRVWTVLLI